VILFIFGNPVRFSQAQKLAGLTKNELDWQKMNWIAKNEQYWHITAPIATLSHFRKIPSTVTGRNLVQFPCDCLLHGAFLANLK